MIKKIKKNTKTKKKPIKKKKPVKKKTVRVRTYNAKIGCWNCNDVYMIKVIKGMNTPEFLQQVDPPCRKCECKTLRVFDEYKMEKEILRDLILHSRLENTGYDNNSKDHIHYG